MSKKVKMIIKVVCGFIIAALSALLAGLCFSSCNVTRKVITESSVSQRGDTSVTIVTRTTESYDASKRLPQ